MKKLNLLFAIIALTFSPVAYAAHSDGGKHIYVDVNGLVCDFCARALEKIFSKNSDVESINVDLDTKVLTINMNDGKTLDDETITKMVTDSGYNVEAIRHEEH